MFLSKNKSKKKSININKILSYEDDFEIDFIPFETLQENAKN